MQINTAEGNRVEELEAAIEAQEQYIIDCRNNRSSSSNVERIRNEVRDLLKVYAAKQSIDLVLYHSDTVFYMTDEVDITDEVLAYYDAL